jgi:hypothetical protein
MLASSKCTFNVLSNDGNGMNEETHGKFRLRPTSILTYYLPPDTNDTINNVELFDTWAKRQIRNTKQGIRSYQLYHKTNDNLPETR